MTNSFNSPNNEDIRRTNTQIFSNAQQNNISEEDRGNSENTDHENQLEFDIGMNEEESKQQQNFINFQQNRDNILNESIN